MLAEPSPIGSSGTAVLPQSEAPPRHSTKLKDDEKHIEAWRRYSGEGRVGEGFSSMMVMGLGGVAESIGPTDGGEVSCLGGADDSPASASDSARGWEVGGAPNFV